MFVGAKSCSSRAIIRHAGRPTIRLSADARHIRMDSFDGSLFHLRLMHARQLRPAVATATVQLPLHPMLPLQCRLSASPP